MKTILAGLLISAVLMYYLFVTRRAKVTNQQNDKDLLERFLEATVKQVAVNYESNTPDIPIGFGYKMNWLAIKSSEAKVICR